jgi:hypothetical protein
MNTNTQTGIKTNYSFYDGNYTEMEVARYKYDNIVYYGDCIEVKGRKSNKREYGEIRIYNDIEAIVKKYKLVKKNKSGKLYYINDELKVELLKDIKQTAIIEAAQKYNEEWEDYFYINDGKLFIDEWYINVKENYINEWIEYRVNGGSNKYIVYEAAMMRDRQIDSILND